MNDNRSWGRYEDAERWRAEAFAALSPAQRFAWLESAWQLHQIGVRQREFELSSTVTPANEPANKSATEDNS